MATNWSAISSMRWVLIRVGVGGHLLEYHLIFMRWALIRVGLDGHLLE